MMQTQFKTPAQVIEFLRPAMVAERLEISLNRVQRASKQDQLPPSWKLALEVMVGHSLPYGLFSFKGVK